jgi:hypothetical protein
MIPLKPPTSLCWHTTVTSQALEAADLIHSGVASRVAIFPDPPDRVDREFIRRGIPYEDAAARAVRELRALGVGTIEQIPKSVHGTEDIGRVLPDWCDQQGFRSVLLVSPSDHSRRLRRMLHRAMKGHHARIIVRCARYSVFDPDRWWESHDGVRTEIDEFEKLLLDVVRHPTHCTAKAWRRARPPSADTNSSGLEPRESVLLPDSLD